MNRIVLIGNGFDLAHGLKTSYKDFIEWYWKQIIDAVKVCDKPSIQDPLLSIGSRLGSLNNAFDQSPLCSDKYKTHEVIRAFENSRDLFSITYSKLFKRIKNNIENKGWVDIEYEYYILLKECFSQPQQISIFEPPKNLNKELVMLNNQFQYLKDKLIEYLAIASPKKNSISKLMKLLYKPITPRDISIESLPILGKSIQQMNGINGAREYTEKAIRTKILSYGFQIGNFDTLDYYDKLIHSNELFRSSEPCPYFFPERILLLNFNYTNTIEAYHKNNISTITNIHGSLDTPNSIIFGYGDELDDDYKRIKETEYKESGRNIKTTKYLESDNHRMVLSFIESAPYQIYIMGHSCGNSDRTLLNTIFEHDNCISIKPYYYQKEDGTDNYYELIQNISRNFTNMKVMRDRVVNKTYCEPMPQSSQTE